MFWIVFFFRSSRCVEVNMMCSHGTLLHEQSNIHITSFYRLQLLLHLTRKPLPMSNLPIQFPMRAIANLSASVARLHWRLQSDGRWDGGGWVVLIKCVPNDTTVWCGKSKHSDDRPPVIHCCYDNDDMHKHMDLIATDFAKITINVRPRPSTPRPAIPPLPHRPVQPFCPRGSMRSIETSYYYRHRYEIDLNRQLFASHVITICVPTTMRPYVHAYPSHKSARHLNPVVPFRTGPVRPDAVCRRDSSGRRAACLSTAVRRDIMRQLCRPSVRDYTGLYDYTARPRTP